VVDPGIGHMGKDFPFEVVLNVLLERDALSVAQFRVRFRTTISVEDGSSSVIEYSVVLI
jgi:hypothetical protein